MLGPAWGVLVAMKYDYKCEQCGRIYELDWRPEHEYGPEYKHMCGRLVRSTLGLGMCPGTIKRVWSTFSFVIKGAK